jgi:hypothetical protein
MPWKYKKTQKKYYNKNKNKILKYHKKYHKDRKKNSPEIYLLSYAKSRSKQNNIIFNIDINDIKVPKRCPILNIPLFCNYKKYCSNSPTIDRKDSNKGYIKGNVWVISHKANVMKNNASKKELKTFAKWVMKQ